MSCTLSVSFSFSAFQSQCASESVNQIRSEATGVYAPSGPTSPPRQTEGNLHCLDPDSSTARFVFVLLIHQFIVWIHHPHDFFPEFIVTCAASVTLWRSRPIAEAQRCITYLEGIWGISVSSVTSVSQWISQQFVLCRRYKLFWYERGWKEYHLLCN